MYPVHPKLAEIHRSVLSSKRLEKIAQSYADDTEVLEKIATIKVQVDAEIFEMLKMAGAGWQAAKQYLTGGGAGKTALKGLIGGTAVGLPTYAVGSNLLRRGREETEETARSIRNRVLEGALGVAATGAGVYGLHKLMGKDKPQDDSSKGSQSSGLMGFLPKFGSDEKARIEETLEKLATVGTIESMLDTLPETLDASTLKLAAEIRTLNRSYGVHLLHGLYPDDV